MSHGSIQGSQAGRVDREQMGTRRAPGVARSRVPAGGGVGLVGGGGGPAGGGTVASGGVVAP